MPRHKFWIPLFDENERRERVVKIQVWWRRMLEVRAAKKPLKQMFEGDVTGLTGLRSLVLIGAHDDVLGPWARAMMQRGPDAMLAKALGEDSTSWLVLMRKAALLLVLSLAYKPESPNASLYLEVLTVLLSNKCAVATLGDRGSAFCQAITVYLMKRKLYYRLRRSISKLPVENSTSLAPFLDFCILPLSTYPENSIRFTEIYINIFFEVLSLPLLPNRFSLDSPSPFISYFLLDNPDKLTPRIEIISGCITPRSSTDLAANIFMLVSPHYERLSTEAFSSYLQLSAALIIKFTDYSLNPTSSSESSTEAENQVHSVDYDSDFSDDHTDYEDSVLGDDEDFRTPLEVTNESVKWIEQVTTPQHITKLINLTQSQAVLLPRLATYLYTVTTTWPSSEQDIHNIVLTKSTGWLIGDLYREVVRRSPLGQEEDSTNIYGENGAVHWPPIILLADLYYKLLHTMDDEEFCKKTPGSPRCNPLYLVEVASFGLQLRNIVFTIYWHSSDDLIEPEKAQNHVWCPSVKALREKLLRCFLRIYARDSRRPFVLPGHWLLRSELDMNSFIDAAVMEEEEAFERFPRRRSEISRKHRYSMQPRLAILKKIPFVIPFEVRISIFQHLIANDRHFHRSTERFNTFGHDQRLRVKIRRGAVVRDAFERLGGIDLKAPLEIVMTDEFGQEADWIDGGGHFKEFLTLFCKQVLQTHSNLWLKNAWGALYPTSRAYATEGQILNWYWSIGRVVGKAIYEGILMEVRFAYFFLTKWLGRRSYFDDLLSSDPALYYRLLSLKHSTGNIEDLSLYFTISTKESGVTNTVELLPNGRNVAVTKENRLLYIDLAARYRLNAQIKRRSEAFLGGLSQLIPSNWLKMFNQQELQILMSGAIVAIIDLDDLRRHTTYKGIYHNNHETIIAFWQVVNSFHSWQRRALLGFVTGCGGSPVLGFKELVPNFSIRDNGSDEDRLPTSSTCVNLLKLPAYKSERQLREMLLQAITSRAGFDSS